MSFQTPHEHAITETVGFESAPVPNFDRVEVPLLNRSIRNTQAMAWFKDHVVVGTARAPVGLADRILTHTENRQDGRDTEILQQDEHGAQILTFDPAMREWRKVYDSPLVTSADAKRRARDRAVRTALVCQTAADATSCLYVAVDSLAGDVVFCRSEDGRNFEQCGGSGFNLDLATPSVRTMACLRGRLYSTPMGKYGSRGIIDDSLTVRPVVLESADPMSGNWVSVSEPGFGDPENQSIVEIAVLDEHLYAATINPRHGFQLWKTDAEGRPPYRWRKIIDRGAWLGATNGVAAAITEFRGALYISGAIQRHRRDGLDRFGPFAAEMLRVHPNEEWDLITGRVRCTPSGLKTPTTGLTGGFGNPLTHAFSCMAVHRGHLYAGTASWRWMPSYLRDRSDLSQERLDRLRAAIEAAPSRDFTLWRTSDGITWESIAEAAFPEGASHAHGIRWLLSTPYGLFVAPAVAPRSPIELWWGQV